MIRRSIREWARISYGASEDEIPQASADRIAAIARASMFSGRLGEGVLEHGRNGLRARGVVGVIATPDCQLEILPKIEAAGETGVSNETLRARLIHMLAVAYDLPIEAGGLTPLGRQRETVLEILIRLFCGKLTDAVRRGMPRQYVDERDDMPALRGRLDITGQFTRLAASPQRLACQFDELSADTALNQVMRAAIKMLSKIASAPENQRSLRELDFAYADIADIEPAAIAWESIVLDRTNERWAQLLSLAKLFLSNWRQHTSAGASDGYALLFEMNVLFERYIERLLVRALAGTGFRVSGQGGHRDCLYEGETGRFRTRPDIIVRHSEKVVLIIDTKWKRMTARIEDPKQGVSQADVYQMMAYSRLYECQNVVLLYPHHAGLSAEPIRARYSIGAIGAAEALVLASQDLTGAKKDHIASLRALVSGCVASPDQSLRPAVLEQAELES